MGHISQPGTSSSISPAPSGVTASPPWRSGARGGQSPGTHGAYSVTACPLWWACGDCPLGWIWAAWGERWASPPTAHLRTFATSPLSIILGLKAMPGREQALESCSGMSTVTQSPRPHTQPTSTRPRAQRPQRKPLWARPWAWRPQVRGQGPQTCPAVPSGGTPGQRLDARKVFPEVNPGQSAILGAQWAEQLA